jgi:hypothetical protein
VFDNANQPFSPVNILNELMENTGIFNNHEMTTFVNFDSESSSLMFQIDERALAKNLDSIAD